MSPMNRVARRELPLLILFCSFSARLFAAPLITYPLGISMGANSLLDVSSGSTQFRLTSGLGGTEPMGAEAGKETPGSDLTSSAGTAGVQNGPKPGDGSAGSADGSASVQNSAHTGEATPETQGTSQTAETGSAGQVTIHPHEFGVGTGKGGTGRVNPADGAIQSRMRAADSAETNRAFAGHVSSIASGSGASQPAGAAADATSGSRSPSNTQGKGTTDTTAPVPSLAPSSPTISSQPAVTPPGQSGAVSSSQTSQVVSNPQGSAALAPSSPTVASQLNPAGAAQMPAGTPGVSSSSALPSSSAGATAGTATPQSGGSTPPASVAGPAGAASQGSNPPSNSSAVTQSPQPSSPSMVSVAPAIASVVSNPPATPAVNNANSSSAPVTNTLGAQFLISLSPSLSNVLGGAGSTAGPTSNPVSTTSAMSALSTGGTSSSTPLSGSPASSNLPLPSVEMASQTLVNPAPDATSTGLVMGILPQNIPEPRVLDMLMAIVTVLALRHVCGHGVPGFWSARGSSIGQRDGDLCSKAGVGDD